MCNSPGQSKSLKLKQKEKRAMGKRDEWLGFRARAELPAAPGL